MKIRNFYLRARVRGGLILVLILSLLLFLQPSNAQAYFLREIIAGEVKDSYFLLRSTLSGFPQISAGQRYTCGLKKDSSLVCWGDNEYGQLNVPAPNAGWVQISAGERHACGIWEDSTMACWGDNYYGKANVPEPNGGWVQVSTGSEHTCGLKEDSTIACWGWNAAGQTSVPDPNSGWVQVSANSQHTCGLKEDSTMACWGSNWAGQTNVPHPNSGWVQVSAGGSHTCGLKEDSTLACWGYTYDIPYPNSGWGQISAGAWHTCGLKEDHTLVCWGFNDYGQTDVSYPNSGWVQVSSGVFHTCGSKQNGTYRCWGDNDYGQAPVVSIAPDSLPPAGVWNSYSEQLSATGGTLPYNFSLSSGSLPVGLSLSSTGILSGIIDSAGLYNFTVLASDANHVAGEQDYFLVVEKADTNTSLAAAPNPSLLGQTVVFTATVSTLPIILPSGTVSFYDGDISITGCVDLALDGSIQAICSTIALGIGNHTITSVYSGDTNFHTSTSPALTQLVQESPPIIYMIKIYLPVTMN